MYFFYVFWTYVLVHSHNNNVCIGCGTCLEGAVGEVQDDGRACPEVGAEGGDTCQLVSLSWAHGCSGLQQVFVHVVAEVAEKSYLLVESRRIILKLMVMFYVGSLYVVDVSVEEKYNSISFLTGESILLELYLIIGKLLYTKY